MLACVGARTCGVWPYSFDAYPLWQLDFAAGGDAQAARYCRCSGEPRQDLMFMFTAFLRDCFRGVSGDGVRLCWADRGIAQRIRGHHRRCHWWRVADGRLRLCHRGRTWAPDLWGGAARAVLCRRRKLSVPRVPWVILLVR